MHWLSFILLINTITMKKTYALLIATLMLSSIILAQERSEEQLKSIAANHFSRLKSQERRALSNDKLEKVFSCNEYVVYNSSGQGSVIVSKNTKNRPVLGYSKAIFDTCHIPCGFQWWLNEASRSLAAQRVNESFSVGHRAYSPVSSFIMTKWGQDQPYNNLTPESEGKHMPTGCMATAMSQIMKYFNYPAKGRGTGYYKNAKGRDAFAIINTEYEWESMKNTYSASETSTMSDAEKRPVAALMRDAGLASQMDYSTDGSGAYEFYAAKGLVYNFQYDSLSLRNYYRAFYPDEEWMSLVYNELSNKRPILYCGQDATSGGHAFILDGIDEEGLVSVNWGWDGSGDGFYDISVLSPQVFGMSANSFSLNQRMIIGFKPQLEPDADEKYESVWGSDQIYDLSVPANNRLNVAGFSAFNYNYLAFSGKLGIFFENILSPDDNYEIIIFNTEDDENKGEPIESHYGFNADNMSKMLKSPYDISSLKPGSYRVFVGSKAIQETNAKPLKCPGGAIEYTLTKEANGKLSLSESHLVTSVKPLSSKMSIKNEGIWYDLSGTANVGIPAKKGVYIVNGKKVIVK